MRRMMFATFLIPGSRHYIELIHPYERFQSCGVSAIQASLYDCDGGELITTSLPLSDIIWDATTLFSAKDQTVLLLHDVTYNLKGKKHPYEYGFLYPSSTHATPIHYPLDVALGLTDAISYSMNYGYFPLGGLPSWLGIRLYLGNASEHGTIEPEITVVSRQSASRFLVSIPPLAHRVVNLGDHRREDIEYLTVRGESKPVCYVAGVDSRTGALTFLEHLMQTFRLDEECEGYPTM